MKICKKCGRLLPESEFTSKQSICRYCRRYKRIYQTYRITEEEYIKMWQEQEGKCKICGKDIGEAYLDIDHDHDTGKVRGLLCRDCNLALDNPKLQNGFIEKAAKYLKEASE